MGAWGTSLYANDVSCDIRGDYIHKLKSGKSNLEVTQELLELHQDTLEDPDEAPLFWFALADTQWNYGRLLPDVKDKALYYLSTGAEDERWIESGAKKYNAWKNTLKTLENKLKAPQPKEKRVQGYRLYQCKWKLGDVFAYKLNSEYSRSLSLGGKYIVFRKISEYNSFPGHRYPIIHLYLYLGDTLPTLDELKCMPVIPALTVPKAFFNYPGKYFTPDLELAIESEKKIPKENLIYLGNYQDNAIIPYEELDQRTFFCTIGWEGSSYCRQIEHYAIEMYFAWNGQEYLLQNNHPKD